MPSKMLTFHSLSFLLSVPCPQALKKQAKLTLEAMEANTLTTEAVEKRNLLTKTVNGLKETVGILRSEIKASKHGHSEARKARQLAEGVRDTHLEQIHELEQTIIMHTSREHDIQNKATEEILHR